MPTEIHHWRFCIRDGTYLDENKPQYNVHTYTVQVIGEDVKVAIDNGEKSEDATSKLH